MKEKLNLYILKSVIQGIIPKLVYLKFQKQKKKTVHFTVTVD